MPDPEYVTLQEAAEILGISVQAVRYHIRKKHLQGYQRLGRVVVRREEVIALGEPKPKAAPSDEGPPAVGEEA